MLDLYELEQFVAFAELGTLAKVAERFHISTPSVTRSMQHLEELFGVSLVLRGKNKISLNETGKMAVVYANTLLQDAEQTVAQVRAFDLRQKTIVVKSCAPAPLWELLRTLNVMQPNRMISSAICQNAEVQTALEDGSCDIGILPFPVNGGKKFMQERLFVCVPVSHVLASHTSLTFEEINGFNFLLRTELGFWDTLCREKMPASRFFIQTDAAAFEELVQASSLPCFITDYVQHQQVAYSGRVNIPLRDAEANVTFYIIGKGTKWGRMCLESDFNL